MKKLLWKRILQRLNMYMTGVLLALGIAIVLGGATPVQAAESGDYEYSVNNDGTVTIEKYTGSERYPGFAATLQIPSILDGKNVTVIGDEAFSDCEDLTSITIPNSVTTIGNGGFWGCEGLTSITIPNSVTTIGKSAFSMCTKLKKITIPAKVTSIGKEAFYGCKNLKNITIKTTKLTSKKIGRNAFKGIHAKATIKVPKKKLATYKKILRKKGVGSKAKIKS